LDRFVASFNPARVYEGVAEVSVYIDTTTLGKRIGSKLMERMIISSEMQGIWTLYSSVFPENTATLKLHEKFGFRTIGLREKIAKLDDKWRDTVLLERRRRTTGL
jgi:L-amino acid N-acyltransferase YncA